MDGWIDGWMNGLTSKWLKPFSHQRGQGGLNGRNAEDKRGYSSLLFHARLQCGLMELARRVSSYSITLRSANTRKLEVPSLKHRLHTTLCPPSSKTMEWTSHCSLNCRLTPNLPPQSKNAPRSVSILARSTLFELYLLIIYF